MKQICYLAVSYDELTEMAKTKALKQAKKKYDKILANDVKLIELLRKQRTIFDINGSLRDLIGLSPVLRDRRNQRDIFRRLVGT